MLTREFHSVMVNICGKVSMAVAVGSLVAVWTAHEPAPEVPTPEHGLQEQIIRVHESILRAISAGDEKGATRLSAAHLAATQAYHMSAETRPHVICSLVRTTLDRDGR